MKDGNERKLTDVGWNYEGWQRTKVDRRWMKLWRMATNESWQMLDETMKDGNERKLTDVGWNYEGQQRITTNNDTTATKGKWWCDDHGQRTMTWWPRTANCDAMTTNGRWRCNNHGATDESMSVSINSDGV